MDNIKDKKLRILEKVANVSDEYIFERILSILEEEESNKVPKEHYDILREDHEKYLKGKLELSSWNDVQKRIEKKYGF
ncbi:hypothetical protein GCM10009117_19890 [Gangjinia marincola]|uniref:Uncharacterized protein n=1 Tax=Gangjinia marincola TaxID=578463 RepID=A0ABP3XWQ1_9FLAO